MLILDKKIPKNGLTFDNTPKVLVRLDKPLPAGYSVMVLRDGEDAGLATLVRGNDFAYTDTPRLGGPFVYSAEVRHATLPAQTSNEWPINVVQINQAWSPTVSESEGPFLPGTSGSKDWNGNYNDNFYIGVVGAVPPDATVTWDYEWAPGQDGWYPPVLTPIPPVYSLPWRLQIQSQSSGYNYSSGVLDVTLKINGVPMGDKLTLVLNDIPYGYEGATWAVWTAPVGKYDLSFTNVYNDGSFPEERSEIRQKITNNTNAAKQFDLYGLKNDALDGQEAYTLPVFEGSSYFTSLQSDLVELYRKVDNVDVLQSTLNVNDVDFAKTLGEFLLDGTPANFRFARIQIDVGGTFELINYVTGDYWGGSVNGNWTGRVNSDITETVELSNSQFGDIPIYRSQSTSETHNNPLEEQYGGAWSWRDSNGNLMTFDTDKFTTPLSAASWSNAGPQFIMSLDGIAPPGRLRLRWTASRAVIYRFGGSIADYTGTPGSVADIYKSVGGVRSLIASGQKANINYVTQILPGDYVEFEFVATTEDRSASRLIPVVELSNYGF